MAEIKKITKEELQDIAGRTGFNQMYLVKDYYITVILYLLKDIGGLYFKGGTALQKIFFRHSRLSEDIDYTAADNVNLLKDRINETIRASGFFEKITKDKHVHDFIRLVVHYTDPFGSSGNVFIDLNKRARVILKPELHRVPNFYRGNIPDFSVVTLNVKELVAEKMAAAIGRNKPRDHFDLYKIISSGLPIDLELVKKKCKSSGYEFSITRMFSRANKLKNRWDKDTAPLVAEEISFQEVMKTLSERFKYPEEKERLRKDKE